MIPVIYDFPIFALVWLLAAFQAAQLFMSQMKDTKTGLQIYQDVHLGAAEDNSESEHPQSFVAEWTW
jgi:hypothetical protein